MEFHRIQQLQLHVVDVQVDIMNMDDHVYRIHNVEQVIEVHSYNELHHQIYVVCEHHMVIVNIAE